MLQIDFKITILLLCLVIGRAYCSLKPAMTFQNSLAGTNSMQDGPGSTISHEVVEKLGDIAKILKDGYQGSYEVATRLNADMLSIIKTQESRIFELEAKLEKLSKGFEVIEAQRAELENLDHRLRQLEKSYLELIGKDDKIRSLMTENKPEKPLVPESNQVYHNRSMIAFDAFRNKPFYNAQAYLTFDGVNVNLGNGFDPVTGAFKAPIPGVYVFNFHALTQDGRATYVKVVHNGKNVAGAYRRHEGEGDESSPGSVNVQGALRRAEGMLAQSVILQLNQSDVVQIFAYHGNLRDGGWHYTHFNGFLIQ